MAAVLPIAVLSNIPDFQVRARTLLLQHAMDITATPPTSATDSLHSAARQVVMSGGIPPNGSAAMIVAAVIDGDYDASDATITAAIESRKHEIYGVAPVITPPTNSYNDPAIRQTAKQMLTSAAMTALNNPDTKTIAREVLHNIDLYTDRVLALATPSLTPQSTHQQVATALTTAINSLAQ